MWTNLNIKYFQEDITKFEKIDLIFNQAFKETKRLDFLANVAGVLLFGKDKSLVDIDLDVYDQVININLKASTYAARKAIPLMQKTGGGSMVHISSVDALSGDDKPQDAYGASKAAMVRLSKSLAIQFASYNIRSNIILPGPIETPMQNRWKKNPKAKIQLSKMIPLQRIGKPKDIANTILFLLSNEASYITGIEITVDGGLTAKP